MQCTAHSRSGKQCASAAIKGANVCRMHGGSAPQVLEKAKQRLLEAADKCAAMLVAQVANSKLDPSVRQRAALAVMDRAGIAPASRYEHTGANGEPLQIPAITVRLVQPGEK